MPPLTFLATWLMRHNPKHSEKGRRLIEQFAKEIGARPPLRDDVAQGIEDRQQMEAAIRLQAASRGHTARLMAGEQKQAARKVQAMARGRSARRSTR